MTEWKKLTDRPIEWDTHGTACTFHFRANGATIQRRLRWEEHQGGNSQQVSVLRRPPENLDEARQGRFVDITLPITLSACWHDGATSSHGKFWLTLHQARSSARGNFSRSSMDSSGHSIMRALPSAMRRDADENEEVFREEKKRMSFAGRTDLSARLTDPPHKRHRLLSLFSRSTTRTTWSGHCLRC